MHAGVAVDCGGTHGVYWGSKTQVPGLMGPAADGIKGRAGAKRIGLAKPIVSTAVRLR